MPGIAFAAVQITEIMYDLSGADTGREWVEITNTGESSVDINKYKLGEGDTNHVLTSVSGGTLLKPGASAVIADDQTLFLTDWPAFSGMLLSSAFSLSNSGETIFIKNASSSVEDSALYTASLGASESGESLHKSGGTFVAAMPNPGVFPGELIKKQKPMPTAPAPKKAKNTKPISTKADSNASPGQIYAPLSVATAHTSTEALPMIVWLAGLGSIIALGLAAAFFIRREMPPFSKGDETNDLSEEFEIIEN